METTMSSPVVEGQEATPASPQATVPPEQSGAQPQETNATQVETSGQTSSDADTRKASDFEAARQIKNLTKIVRSLQQSIEGRSQSAQPQSSQPQAQARNPVTREDLLADPINAIQRMLDAQKQELMGKIPETLSVRDKELKHERSIQEGWKIIRSNDAFKRDPNGEDKINEILEEEDEDGNSLQKYSTVNPVHAAKLALQAYNQRYGAKKDPAPPTKQQMISTATASYSGGGKIDINAEALKLQREAMDNPDLMKDPQWIARLNAVKSQFNQLKFGAPNPSA